MRLWLMQQECREIVYGARTNYWSVSVKLRSCYLPIAWAGDESSLPNEDHWYITCEERYESGRGHHDLRAVALTTHIERMPQ